MRKLRIATVLPSLLTVLLIAAPTPSASATGPHRIYGHGQAFAAGRSYIRFGFAAHGGPHQAHGHITMNWPPATGQPVHDHGQLRADVRCLVIDGHGATAYGMVTESINPDVPFTPDWVGIYVTDTPRTFYGFFGFGSPPCDNEPHGPVPFYTEDRHRPLTPCTLRPDGPGTHPPKAIRQVER